MHDLISSVLPRQFFFCVSNFQDLILSFEFCRNLFFFFLILLASNTSLIYWKSKPKKEKENEINSIEFDFVVTFVTITFIHFWLHTLTDLHFTTWIYDNTSLSHCALYIMASIELKRETVAYERKKNSKHVSVLEIVWWLSVKKMPLTMINALDNVQFYVVQADCTWLLGFHANRLSILDLIQ